MLEIIFPAMMTFRVDDAAMFVRVRRLSQRVRSGRLGGAAVADEERRRGVVESKEGQRNGALERDIQRFGDLQFIEELVEETFFVVLAHVEDDLLRVGEQFARREGDHDEHVAEDDFQIVRPGPRGRKRFHAVDMDEERRTLSMRSIAVQVRGHVRSRTRKCPPSVWMRVNEGLTVAVR